MSLPLGYVGRFFPDAWRPVAEETAFAERAGFSHLQIMGQGSGTETWLRTPLAQVRRELDRRGLRAVMEVMVSLDERGVSREGSRPIDMLRRSLDAILTLGCDPVHVHVVPFEPLDSAALDPLLEALAGEFGEAVELAAEAGFTLGIENNDPRHELLANPRQCAAFLAEVDGLGLVWDVNHTPRSHHEGYLELAPRMSMLHLSDTPLPEVNHHLPLGRGAIDFDRLLPALLDAGADAPAILEIGGVPWSGGFGQDTDEALEESARKLNAALGNR